MFVLPFGPMVTSTSIGLCIVTTDFFVFVVMFNVYSVWSVCSSFIIWHSTTSSGISSFSSSSSSSSSSFWLPLPVFVTASVSAINGSLIFTSLLIAGLIELVEGACSSWSFLFCSEFSLGNADLYESEIVFVYVFRLPIAFLARSWIALNIL